MECVPVGNWTTCLTLESDWTLYSHFLLYIDFLMVLAFVIATVEKPALQKYIIERIVEWSVVAMVNYLELVAHAVSNRCCCIFFRKLKYSLLWICEHTTTTQRVPEPSLGTVALKTWKTMKSLACFYINNYKFSWNI